MEAHNGGVDTDLDSEELAFGQPRHKMQTLFALVPRDTSWFKKKILITTGISIDNFINFNYYVELKLFSVQIKWIETSK